MGSMTTSDIFGAASSRLEHGRRQPSLLAIASILLATACRADHQAARQEALAFASASATSTQAAARCEGPLLRTNFYAVLANPERFEGRRVQLTGVLETRERVAALFPSFEQLENYDASVALTVGSSEDRAPNCSESIGVSQLRGCERQRVIVEGCFSYDGSTYWGSLEPVRDVRPLVQAAGSAASK